MGVAGNKKLTFHLGGIGFLLDLSYIVEVIEQIHAIIDPNRSDIGRGIVSALEFRHTWIPVVDPAIKLGLNSPIKLKEKVVLVLNGTEGNWALVVDRVNELLDEESLIPCAIPFLLKIAAMGCYSQLMLLNDEPYVVFEPERHYGSVAMSA